MHNFTLKDLVNFCLDQRDAKRAFIGWEESDIAYAIYKRMEENGVIYATDKHNIVGVCLFDVDFVRKLAFIEWVVVDKDYERKGVLGELLIKGLKLYGQDKLNSGWSLIANNFKTQHQRVIPITTQSLRRLYGRIATSRTNT